MWTVKRLERLRKALTSNDASSLVKLADKLSITKQGLSKASQRFFPELLEKRRQRKELQRALTKKEREDAERTRCLQIYGRPTSRPVTQKEKWIARRFRRKRNNNARKHGKHVWELTVHDLVFPDFCPMLGIKLDYSVEKGRGRRDNAPSFDRLDSRKGYVKGNVIVCSCRANRIKNNADAAELERIAAYLRKMMPK